MKKHINRIIVANKAFIVLQITLSLFALALNFLKGEPLFFIAFFVHTAIYVIFNIVVESISEYGFLRKEYSHICESSNQIFYVKLLKRIYDCAKEKDDEISQTLLKQKLLKDIILIVNLVLMILIVPFE